MREAPNSYSRYPMLFLAIGFACGVVIGRAGVEIIGAGIVAASVIAIARIRQSVAPVILPLVFIPLGIFCHFIETNSLSADRVKRIYEAGEIASYEPVEIEGVLKGYPEPANRGSFLTLRAERLRFRQAVRPVSGNVRLFVIGSKTTDGEADLRHGSIVRVACRLEREDRYLNPGVAIRTQLLDEQGIDAVATVKSALLVEKMGDDAVFLPLAWAYKHRTLLIGKFRELFGRRTAGVLTASLLGQKQFLDRETAEVFREGGTFHVLVISGLHITFIGGLTLWLVSLFTKRPYLQASVAASFLWAYTLAVGAETPVVRASLMFSFLLLSKLIYRQSSLLNALGACTLMLLVWRPSDLFSVSFQLTFVSVAAIVACAFPLIEKLRATGAWTPSRETPLPSNVSRRLRRTCEFFYWNDAEWSLRARRNIWSAGLFKSPYLACLAAPNLKIAAAYVVEGLLVSVIVQVAMLPLVIIYFHRVTPAGVVLNLWVGAFLALESFTAIAAVIIASFSTWLAEPVIGLTEFLNVLMIAAPAAVAALDIADLRVPVYSGPLKSVYLLYGVVIMLASVQIFKWDPFALCRKPGQLRISLILFLPAAVLAFIVVFHPYSAPPSDGHLRIDFLDVGQGDSALITFPDGQTMLVDGGGLVQYRDDESADFEPDIPRIGETVVSEFLWEKGYSRVDYLVATHADADHIQGLVDVARNFDIGILILGAMRPSDPDLAQLIQVADAKKIPVRTVSVPDEFSIAAVDIRVLSPPGSVSPASGSTNNESVVLHLGFGSRSFILTGDIEREAEHELERFGSLLKADVVKVPHHGSRTSSTPQFVDMVGARIAVIPVGRRSRFGHPHGEVVERWRSAGSEVMTIGERGTITVKTDGERLAITTFLP